MTDPQLAKELLVADKIMEAIPLTIEPNREGQKYEIVGREIIPDSHSFDNTEMLVVRSTVHTDDGWLNKFNSMKFYFMFTNWHIENQDMKRETKESIICNNMLIYSNELINVQIANVQRLTKPILHENPFDSTNQYKITAYRFYLRFTLDMIQAEMLLPELNKFYLLSMDYGNI